MWILEPRVFPYFFHSVLPTYDCLHLKYLQWKGYTLKEIKGLSENQRAKTQVIINHWTFPPEDLVAFDLLHRKPRLPTVICPTKHRWRKRLNLLNYFRKWKGKKRSDHQSLNFSTGRSGCRCPLPPIMRRLKLLNYFYDRRLKLLNYFRRNQGLLRKSKGKMRNAH